MICFRMKDGKSARKYCIENGIKYGRFFVLVDAGLSTEEAIKIATNNGDSIVKRILNELKIAIKENNTKEINEKRSILSKIRGKKNVKV